MTKLLGFAARLDKERIPYRVDIVRDAVMLEVSVPGERWEIEFFEDDHVEIERFRSSGEIEGEELLEELIRILAE